MQLILSLIVSTAVTIGSIAGMFYNLRQDQQHNNDVQNARNDVQDANMLNQRNEVLSIRNDMKDLRSALATKQDRNTYPSSFKAN